MSLDVQIKIDPGDSKTKVDDVVRTVDKAEDTANAAKKAFAQLGDAVLYMTRQIASNATRAFASLSDAIGYKLNTQITQTIRGFNSLAEAMQREHAMLVTIRGDTQAYARDVQVLNSLMDRGKITAQEYDAALASAGRRHGVGDAAVAAPKQTIAGGLIESGLGQAAAVVGPAALAATAIHGISDAFAEMHARAKETGEVNAAMLRYTDSLVEARVATEQMRQVSTLLGDDLKTTAGAFLDIADAAGSLNLSHEKLVDITRSLGLIMTNEGKSIGDVGTVMSTLEFAISKGTISSGELARIMKQFPPLAAIWREEFGATTKQLLEAADNGQLATLGLDRLLTSIRTTPDTVDKARQRFVALHQELDATKPVWGDVNQLVEINRLKVGEAADANRKLIDVWDTASTSATTLVEDLGDLWSALKKLGEDPWGNTVDNRNTVAQGLDQIIAFAHQGVQAAEKFSDKWKKAAQESRQEIEKLAEAFAKMQRIAPKPLLGSELGGRDAYDRYVEAEVERLSQPQEPDLERDLAGVKMPWDKKRPNYLTDMWMRQLEEMRAANEDFSRQTSQVFQDMGQNLIDAAFRGEASWSDMLRSISMNMLKLLAIRALSSGGFDTSMIGGLRMPGFASGGSFMVGGHGGTDTTPVAFMATPGERVTVETPQQRGNDGGGSGGSKQPIYVVLDESTNEREMENFVIRVIRRNKSGLRGEITGK
jgi:tape measure domain-containing protein